MSSEDLPAKPINPVNKPKKKHYDNFNSFIKKLAKTHQYNIRIDKNSIILLDSIIKEQCKKIINECQSLLTKPKSSRQTLSFIDVQAAVDLLYVPPDNRKYKDSIAGEIRSYAENARKQYLGYIANKSSLKNKERTPENLRKLAAKFKKNANIILPFARMKVVVRYQFIKDNICRISDESIVCIVIAIQRIISNILQSVIEIKKNLTITSKIINRAIRSDPLLAKIFSDSIIIDGGFMPSVDH